MRPPRIAALILAVCSAVAATAVAVPEAVPKVPVLTPETKTGSIVRHAAPNQPPTAKVVDGNASDWTGEITRLGGTAVYSRGEYVYQDYLGDAWGADDGYDAGRKAALDTAKSVSSRTYRVDALQQAAGAQFGAGRPVGASLRYGDTVPPPGVREQADIEEVRIAADPEHLYVMVRTLAMTGSSPATAVAIFLDIEAGGPYSYPPAAGGVTSMAEHVFVASGNQITGLYRRGVPLISGCQLPCVPAPWTVASNPAGFDNVVEIAIRRDALDAAMPSSLRIGVATGIAGPGGIAAMKAGDAKSDLINVAFRSEPARIWMDERQTFALRDGSIDEFFASIDLGTLEAGATETFTMRPGYYEAVYVNGGSPVNLEQTVNGYFQGPYQHYGVYLPDTYRPGNVHPAMFWMHYRGGHAHDAAAWEPGVLHDFGDGGDAIVVTPSARGESSWYTGRGMVDYLDVWDDAHARWSIDEDRTYLGGHSMGGWASWLLGLLFPDRWAASNPQDGLLVPGLWAGAGPPSSPQNGADVEAEFLYPLLENARNLPYAILHGTADQLVPVTGAIAAGQRLHDLGYRYRTYLYHAYEHFSAPIWDDWREMQSSMWSHRRDRNPERVTYKVSPALNHAVSTISVPTGVDLGFEFNGAYWVSGMKVRAPGRAPSNLGTIDVTTYGRGLESRLLLPEASAGVFGPYTMHGQRWVSNGRGDAANVFDMTATNLSDVTLDLARMSLSTAAGISGRVATDGLMTLRLGGTWPSQPAVTGATVVSYDGATLVLRIPAAGVHHISVV
ncbi:MAG TPA: hypothetical protein VM841_07600 [Actinomycetota bacterium]|nr:hypothetical protein [Actinomycetota bacterium]